MSAIHHNQENEDAHRDVDAGRYTKDEWTQKVIKVLME